MYGIVQQGCTCTDTSSGNGSDVFGSDICTCKPYLVYAIEECIRGVQSVALVSLFTSERKVEPLAKSLSTLNRFVFGFYDWMYSERYLVYNLRKRGGDSADRYFKSTEMIAGVKDMRFQALMPDVLHWLGIKKIDRMVSMSDM